MTSPSDNRTFVRDMELGRLRDHYLLTAPEIHETKNGDPYLRATLQDQTGSIPLVMWDTPEAPEPDVYEVRGDVEDYKGTRQVKAGSITRTDRDPEYFVEASPVDVQYLQDILNNAIDDLEGEVGKVIRSIFDETRMAEFLESPAAKTNHHAYLHGLAEHVVSMLTLASFTVEHYRKMYQEPIDMYLVVTGVLLHDLGKIKDLEQTDPGAWDYGARGEMVGHIADAATMVSDACTAVLASERTERRLMHMVLAHHGKREWGSPVEPCLLEAQIVHQIDMLDSRVAMIREATEGLEEGESSDWVKPLGGRYRR